MKPDAQEGEGPYFGMTERYDRADIGLNPILYWSKDNYKKVARSVTTRSFQKMANDGDDSEIAYKKVEYAIEKK